MIAYTYIYKIITLSISVTCFRLRKKLDFFSLEFHKDFFVISIYLRSFKSTCIVDLHFRNPVSCNLLQNFHLYLRLRKFIELMVGKSQAKIYICS